MNSTPLFVEIAGSLVFDLLRRLADDNPDRLEVVYRREGAMRIRFKGTPPDGRARYVDYLVREANTPEPAQ